MIAGEQLPSTPCHTRKRPTVTGRVFCRQPAERPSQTAADSLLYQLPTMSAAIEIAEKYQYFKTFKMPLRRPSNCANFQFVRWY